jgi:hypothetical protein
MDSTAALQQTIDRFRKDASGPVSATIKLEKGDYALRAIEIPKNSTVTLLSKDRVRLLYIGKRNRPMFILGENSSLVLGEKLEIFYNTNNIREAIKLMIKTTQKNSVNISKDVKIAFFSRKVE